MRCVISLGDGTLSIGERPSPRPGPGEVRVRVHAAGLNRADLLQRAGFYPAPPGVPADIPGLEFAGEVNELGEGVASPAIGARVFGIAAGGAQAEEIVVASTHCAVVPESLDLVSAGGVPEVFLTAHDALRTQALLLPGERVLVHAVGSGVGTAVLQLARAWGCETTGTARTPEKLSRAQALGLDNAILAPREIDPLAFAAQITEAAGGPIDVTADLVGGAYVTTDVLASAAGGRIVLIGTLAGGRCELPILAVMSKRLRLFGTVLRPRTSDEKSAATAAFVAEVVPLLASGAVAPVIETVLPLSDAEQGYELLASDTTFGKVILDCR